MVPVSWQQAHPFGARVPLLESFVTHIWKIQSLRVVNWDLHAYRWRRYCERTTRSQTSVSLLAFHLLLFSLSYSSLSGILPAGMEAGFVELSSLLAVAASLDDEIREICRARDSERFLKLVANYQSRIHALQHGEFLIFGGGTWAACKLSRFRRLGFGPWCGCPDRH